MGIQRWDMDGMLEYSARTGDVIGAEVRPYEMEKGDYVLFTDHEQVVADLEQQVIVAEQFCVEQDREITRLRAELAAKSKDAERYRWLRKFASDSNQVSGKTPTVVWVCEYSEGWNASFDKAIDQAMGEGNGR